MRRFVVGVKVWRNYVVEGVKFWTNKREVVYGNVIEAHEKEKESGEFLLDVVITSCDMYGYYVVQQILPSFSNGLVRTLQ